MTIIDSSEAAQVVVRRPPYARRSKSLEVLISIL